MMKKLTDRIEKYIEAYQLPPLEREVDGTVELLHDVLEKLEEYKNLEEQGLLFQFPVPIGTTVYKFESSAKGTKRYIKTTITRYEAFDDSIWFTFANGLGRNIEDFGKYVFLTKAEAEKKLKEMER